MRNIAETKATNTNPGPMARRNQGDLTMKTTLIAAIALTAAAAPLSAASLNVDLDALSISQQAQVFNVMNSDENQATRERLIEAIVSDANATKDGAAAAEVRFIEESDESSATRERLIDAARY